MSVHARAGSALVASSRVRGLVAACLVLILAACGGGAGTEVGGSPVGAGSDSGGAGGSGTPVSGSGQGGTATADDPAAAMAAALTRGDARGLSLPAVMASTKNTLLTQMAEHAATRQGVFGLQADGRATTGSLSGITWNPSHDSTTFNLLDQGRNHVMLPSNWRYSDSAAGNGKALAVTGIAPLSGTRYAAFSGNPLAVRGNAPMDAMLRNTVAWLTGRSQFDQFKVVTAHLPGRNTYWFQHEGPVREWLNAQFPGLTINGVAGTTATDDSCDGDRLDACLQGVDLLVIGRQQGPNTGDSTTPDTFPGGYDSDTVMTAVMRAQARGIPVLYLHHYRDANALATRLLDYFGLGITNNYWAQEGLKAFDPAAQPVAPGNSAALLSLLERLETQSFTTDWTGCLNDLGRTLCETSGSTPGNAALMDEFIVPGKALRTQLRSLDAQGLALFSQPGYDLEKRMVLLGDKYRETVSYPMSKQSSRQAFFQAYFSDFTAYINRPTQAVARNLGNFSGLFPADTPTLSRVVTGASLETGTRELMTGLYVMPGRTVTLQRTDNGTQGVTVGLNLLRDTTHVYDTYDRPTLLASPRVALLPGKTVTLTSPYGGPMTLFIGAAPGAPEVAVQVSGVITHPYLRDAKDPVQVAAFKSELASTPTNWVAMGTEFLSVHSSLDHFRQTLADYGDDMSHLVSDLWTYMIKDTYELAGFSSATAGRFELSSSVSAFCASAGWDCTGPQHRRDVMQHVISDVYSDCGSGCSGNPYDQNWALEPLGWGESHEIGHNLQRPRLNIYGGLSSEVSNNIFPMHKQIRFNRDTAPASPLTRNSSARAAFDLIKSSLSTGDPRGAMTAAMWTDTRYGANGVLRLSFYRQLVEIARHYRSSEFVDGWELYTLMYLLDRNLSASESQWTASRDALGFGTYAAAPSGMDGNDFMLIASSRIIGRDMRPVFSLWGITFSAAASAQVSAYSLPAAEALFFPMSSVLQDGRGVAPPVTMSPAASYPAGY